jgi:hypothetical protein
MFNDIKGNPKAVSYGVKTRAVGMVDAGDRHFLDGKAHSSGLD